MEKEEKIKVIVCGTTFGKFYIDAIKMSNRYVLSGILAKGSERSKKTAIKYEVPMYSDIEEIPQGCCDLACVVLRSSIVGGEGTRVAQELMKKGISVIQEQPVHYKEIIENYKYANKYNVFYAVNTFYPSLDISRIFIRTVKLLEKKTEIEFIEASCCIQVLLPFLDVLANLTGGITPFKIDSKIVKSGCYTVITGTIKNKPVILHIQNQIAPDDPDNYFYTLYRISIGTNSGTLLLTEANGGILWNPRIYHNRRKHIDNGDSDKEAKIPIVQLINKEYMINNNYREMTEQQLPKAIFNFLEQKENEIRSKKFHNCDLQHNVMLCELWKEVSAAIGNSELILENQVNTLIYKDEEFKNPDELN